MNVATDGISFVGVQDDSISLSVDETGTATFTSGDASETVTDFSSINTIILDGNTLKAELADLNGRTVTGGTVEGTLPDEKITTNEFTDKSSIADWKVDRAEPQSFMVNGGQLQQVIEAPADGATNDTYYAVQGYKLVNLGGGNGVSSMSIDLTIPQEWLNLDVPDDVDAIRLAGFWGRGGSSADDYPLIDVTVKKDESGSSVLGFYAWDTVTGDLSLLQQIDNPGTYKLGIQVANGMYAYSIDGEVLGSTPIDETSTLPLSTVYLQGYSYASEKSTANGVTYATVKGAFKDKSYTITWDNFTTTTASPVTGDLDLSGISGLKLNAPLSVGESATLTINADQANELIIIGEGTVKIDASDATADVVVKTVGDSWAGYGNHWYNDKGFADGQLAAVIGSSKGDFFSLDLADIGTLKENTTGSSGADAPGRDAPSGDSPSGDPSDDESASDNTISFTARNGLSLDGNDGDDTLMLTWFAPTGTEGHTLETLNQENFFKYIDDFETIIFNKGNLSNNLQIDASSLGMEGNDVTNLTLKTSATITGINEKLTIGFTEENLTSAVNLDLTPADGVDNLTLAIQTTGTGYINLTVAKSVETINFTEFDAIRLQDSTIIGTSDGKDWKVDLSGVDGTLSFDFGTGILTIGQGTGA